MRPVLAACLCLALACQLDNHDSTGGDNTRTPRTRLENSLSTRTRYTEGLRTPARGRDNPAHCNSRRSLDLPSMYTTWSGVRHLRGPAAENHGFSSTGNLCPFSTPTTKRWYQSGEGESEPSSNPYHSTCDSCTPTTTTTTPDPIPKYGEKHVNTA